MSLAVPSLYPAPPETHLQRPDRFENPSLQSLASYDRLNAQILQEISSRFNLIVKDSSSNPSSAGPSSKYNDPSSQLPLELFIEVFSYLDLKDIVNISKVSQSWHQAALNPIVWRQLYTKYWRFRFDLLDPKLQLDWYNVFKIRHKLTQNWLNGHCKSHTFHSHSDSVYFVKCHDMKSLLFTASRDGTIKTWDLETKKCLKSLGRHQSSILCVDFDLSNANIIVSGSSDGTITVWDHAAESVLAVLRGHKAAVLNVHIWKNEKQKNFLVSCSKDSTIRLWSLGSLECINTLVGHTSAVNSMAIFHNHLVSASMDRTVRLWDLATCECLQIFTDFLHSVCCVAYDGNTIACGSSDRSIKIFNINKGRCLNTIYNAHSALVRTIRFNGDFLITGSYEGSIRLWQRRLVPTDVSPALVNCKFNTNKNKKSSFGQTYLNKGVATEAWDLVYDISDEQFGNVYNISSTARFLVASGEASAIKYWDFGHQVEHISLLSRYFAS